MSDRKLTLTDIMLGVYNLGLCSKIPSAQFRFLIGLILKGNSLGFKKVMEITNGEAMSIGGGNSRQSVNRLRQGLCEFMIDDKPILDVVHGEHLKNVSAKYEVNYDLLVGNGSIWRRPKPLPSQNYDGSSDASVDGYDDANEKIRHKKVTDAVTTPRSDQKEETTADPDVDNLVNLMQEKWPHENPPNYATVRRMIKKFSLSVCVDAMDGTREDMGNRDWSSIYKYMRKVAGDIIPLPKPTEQSEEEKVTHHMIQIVKDYRTLDPETGLTSRSNRIGFLINSIRNYEKWYDVIDNFGTIVGMELDEYRVLMNGGVI